MAENDVQDASWASVDEFAPGSLLGSVTSNFELISLSSGQRVDWDSLFGDFASIMAEDDVQDASWALVDEFAPGSLVGSVTSNFELISLSSGQRVKKCKRCTVHNPVDATICDACECVLTNDIDMIDSQIAVALQRTKDEMADEEDYNHPGYMLAQTIFLYLKDFEKANTWLRLLSFDDICHHTVAFVNLAKKTSGGNPQMRLAYKFTASDEKTWNIIRMNGFKSEAVSSNVDAAFKLHKQEVPRWLRGESCMARRRPPGYNDHLARTGLIYVDSSDKQSLSKDRSLDSGWIVATVEFDGDRIDEHVMQGTSGLWPVRYFPNEERILPLIRFDSLYRYDNEIRRMLNGLTEIVSRFSRAELGQ